MKKQRRRMQQNVTIRDVATRAGVSPMTVSRVINNGSNVTDATRSTVMSAIRDLNYAPNPSARRLAGHESFRIGLLYSNPSAAFLSELLIGVLGESSKTGHQLMVEKCGANAASERAALRKLLDGGATGLILPPPLCETRSVLSEMQQAGIAIVSVAAGNASADFATVRMDNYKAAWEMTEYLLSLGHRNIGFIKGHPNQTVSDQRLQGFLDALKAAGVDPSGVGVEQGYFTYRSGATAAEQLLSRRQRPTAIFAANDDMAAATLATAHRMGIDVPGDLSIAGFDDTPIAATLWPTLTTVRQPIAAMARTAVQSLLKEMRRHHDKNPRPPSQQLLRHVLVKRGSTGPVPTATRSGRDHGSSRSARSPVMGESRG